MNTRSRQLALVVALLTWMAGCTTTIRYVVADVSPSNPTITVIPMSPSGSDFAYADAATGHLISFGLRVVERPALAKLRTEVKGMTSPGGGTSPASLPSEVSKQSDVSSAWDPVALIGETHADYVLFVGDGPRVRLVRRETGQILSTGSLALGAGSTGSGCCLAPAFWGSLQSERERYRELLRSAGLVPK
ncbi:hypothetical protein FJY68_07895 [candidate division WOR-3 bacterium]|uniref:Uncharacterized protein n=1 Tax=candidate division WOR-3 bacterium TaxID=2052148 RepID=A0A938BRL9_UNCW3|nr:hypothetical protein [candidate division WOR-3 bacterium]